MFKKVEKVSAMYNDTESKMASMVKEPSDWPNIKESSSLHAHHVEC